MKIADKNSWEYTLAIPYTTDEELGRPARRYTLKQRGPQTFVTGSLKVISPNWTTRKRVGDDDIRAQRIALTIEPWPYVGK